MNLMIKTIKQVHDKDVCIFKIGSFYHVYGKDAKIIAYLFGYKIKEIEGSNIECGFPLNAINKIKSKLENLKINYLIIDRRNNYDIDEISNNKESNEYFEYYEKASKFINIKRRVQNINSFLMDNINSEDFSEVLKNLEQAKKSTWHKI